MLSVLNIMVFLLPPETGNRIGFTLTLLLALTVFLTIMSDNIPKSSSPMRIWSYLIGLQLLLSSIICFVTVIKLNFYYKEDQTDIPSCVSLGCHKQEGHDVIETEQTSADDKSCHKSTANRQSELKPSVVESVTSEAPPGVSTARKR